MNFSGDDGVLEDPTDEDVPMKVKEEAIQAKTTWQIEHEQYLRLCRGDVERSPKVMAQLKCYFNFGTDPYLALMPHKEEVVNIKPRISIFYDVLTDNEIATVKELATPRVRINLGISQKWMHDFLSFCSTVQKSNSPKLQIRRTRDSFLQDIQNCVAKKN